ncbi:MAG: asparagine synthase (glutamine-hydrolyzing) [Planctomycetia bacterium]|nr:asparagine synthase (glutamine-hydrolyzing) [Planctomycetia bacterium]
MCGICGFINLDGSPASADVLRPMNETLHHRGPDDHGEFVEGAVALGHRRLAILDPARGRQPMSGHASSTTMVYNGEIYNHLEIRPRLPVSPNAYRTTSDTETILAAYDEWGHACVEHFRGMFALAIFDAAKNQLFLARDRLGIKPLYYYSSPTLFAFASEIKALLAHPAIAAEVNTERLPVQLAVKYTLDEQTLFRGIKKLLPGHTLTVADGRIIARQYWDLSYNPKPLDLSFAAAADAFRASLSDAVRSHLLSDVPLGVFLSGGIDSSIIAVLMSTMMDEPVKTFSVAFHEPGYSELNYAQLVARHIGSDHREVVVSPDEWFAAWPRMLYHEDEPIAHPSSIPLYFVSRLAAEHVKVVLTGEGADELLAGYERYYQTLMNLRMGRLLPGAARAAAHWMIDRLPDRSVAKRKAVRTSLYLQPDVQTLYLDNYASFPRPALARALRPEYRGAAIDTVYAPFMAMLASSDAAELLDRVLYADMKTYLVELLMKQDQMSMAASIESRVPFLDHPLVELVCRMPTAYKLRRFQTKRLMREAMGPMLPPAIVRRGKRGFPTPIKEWFHGGYYPLIEKLLASEHTLCTEYVDRAFVVEMLDRHRSGRGNLQEQIWSLANFEIWLRVFIEGREPEAVFGDAAEVRACTYCG